MTATAALTPANEPVTIGDVLAYPESYQLRVVTLQGIVREVQALEPVFAECGPVFNSSLLTLDDGTGHLDVTVAGACYDPAMRIPISPGERISARVLIQVQDSGRRIVHGQVQWFEPVGK